MKSLLIQSVKRMPQKRLDELKDLGVTIYDGPRLSVEELKEKIADVEVLAAFYNDDLEKVIYDAPKLKHFINTAVGYERLDLDKFKKNGVIVSNCRSYNSQAVAELAVGLLLTLIRKINLANQDLMTGEWHDENFPGTEVGGKKVGLIGHGNIGKIIEKIVHAMNAQVRFINSKSTPLETDELCEWADIIFVCAALNAKTKHILNKARIETLRPGSVIINVSRGAIIEEDALYERLKKGDLSAGLDVFEHEPERGVVNQEVMRLVELPNVVATPHIAYNTVESGDKLGQEIIANIKASLAGKPINVIEVS